MLRGLELKILAGIVIAVLALIWIPNYDQLKEKLGFETRTSLSRENEALRQIQEQLEATNKANAELKKEMERIEAARRLLDQELIAERKRGLEVVTEALKKRNKATAKPAIKPNQEKVTKPSEVIVDKEAIDEASKANILSLWEIHKQLSGVV